MNKKPSKLPQWVEKSASASKVPLKIADKRILRQIANMLKQR